MPYKLIFIIANVLYSLLISSQSLILDKINDIPVRDGFAVVYKILPLSKPDSIIVALETSDYSLGSHYNNVSILTKDDVINVFQTYYEPYPIAGLHIEENQLIIVKINANSTREILTLRYDIKHHSMIDSFIVKLPYSYKEMKFSKGEVICFGKNSVDSLLLHQSIQFNDKASTQFKIGLIENKKLSFGSGNIIDDHFLYALSDYTEEANNYLIIKKKDNSLSTIKYNSSDSLQNEVFTLASFFTGYEPIALVNGSIAYIASEGRREVNYEFTRSNSILFSLDINTQQLNWQYHGFENLKFDYFKATPKGVHLYYKSRDVSRYEFINTKGELTFEDKNSELIRYCTQKDECIVYRNDTLFLKKFGEVLAYYAFENLDQYNMLTFHPDDKHHYVSLREKGGNTMSIYQLKLDTLDTGIFNATNIERFNLYPNPANTLVNLELPVFQQYDLEIINLHGQVVERLTIKGKVNVIQPKFLEEGTYCLKAIGQNNQTYFSRLLWLK